MIRAARVQETRRQRQKFIAAVILAWKRIFLWSFGTFDVCIELKE